eukprot:CAMPEP_0198228064 /NCGR_PEP_ID=MMETSP1445-20131203/111728_1 /TAXON_ID=36898 /ORGANISM="Pyramimonas sp., Strain CCMP2087" /LENGTH=53 /DNA_ID=CAMNT_0043908313 /DNA_START=49 /DNA_END=205 /DNA_ORIENTATION=+
MEAELDMNYDTDMFRAVVAVRAAQGFAAAAHGAEELLAARAAAAEDAPPERTA